MTKEQVQAVTGYKSDQMTDDNYNHIDPTEIEGVIKAQRAIAGKKEQPEKKPAKTSKSKTAAKTFMIVKPSSRKYA